MTPPLPDLLFHGSERQFDLPRGGGYDGVFWTASDSATAQNYIPASGSSIQTAPMDYQLKEKLRPRQNDPFTSIAASMGFVAQDVKWDALGQASSYRYPPQGMPTYGDICDHIEKVLGYEPTDGRRGAYRLKAASWSAQDQQSEIVRSDFKMPGHLYIVTGHESMRLHHMSRGEGDLTDVQYNKLSSFQQMKEAGFDGVVIDDFAQSKTWGNLGHISYGFFPEACNRLKLERISAANFDWGPTSQDLQVVDSPEFTRWRAAQNAKDFIQSINTSPLASPSI